jgi:peptidoglycan/LPS O-acetylase OafA/YrhL
MPNVRSDRDLGGQFIAGDPLRALAALWIVSYHVVANALSRTTDRTVGTDFSVSLGEIGHVISRARFSVFLFFALSGYLLGRPFIHALITGRRMPRLVPYFRNRALRILPVLWVVSLATVVLRGRQGTDWSHILAVPGFSQVYATSPFSNALPQAWTLDNEIIFYVALPLLALAAAPLFAGRGSSDRRALVVLAFLVVTAGLSLLYRIDQQTDFKAVNYFFPGVWFAFTAGLGVAAVEPVLRDRVQTARAGRIAATSVLAVGLGLLIAYVYNTSTSIVPPTLYAGVSVFCLLLAPLMLQWTTGSCWRFFDNRPLHWLGERSYSFYLWHVLVFVGLGRPLPEYDQPWLTVLVLLVPAFAVASLVAAISYRYIEQPFLRRKHLWRRSEQARPGAEHAGAPVITGPEVAATPAARD